MSGSSRKRASKWDLREEPCFESDNVQDRGWSGKASMSSIPEKELQDGWKSPEILGSTGSKWSSMEVKASLKYKHDKDLLPNEPLVGSRGSNKDDVISKGCSRKLESSGGWDGDGSYGTRMSPGLDGWRKQNGGESTRNGWSRSLRDRSRSSSRSRSRSRSRSPAHGFRREIGFYDRSRGRSGVSAQLCRDFESGRCRRGSDCQFLHHESQNYNDNLENRHRKGSYAKYSTSYESREYQGRSGRSIPPCADFLKGRCQRGASCKYVHDDSSDFGRASSNDVIRERDIDRRNKDSSVDLDVVPESRRTGDIPCKFFAAGNCRNGKHCRYSHHNNASVSPERKPRKDRLLLVHKPDGAKRLLHESSDATTSNNAVWFREGKNEEIGVLEPRVTSCSVDGDGWGHGLNNESKPHMPFSYEGNQNIDNESVIHKAKDATGGIIISEYRDPEKWHDDMEMSPDWNHKGIPSNLLVKVERNLISQDSNSLGDISLSSHKHDATPLTQSIMFEKPFSLHSNNMMPDNTTGSYPNDKGAIENIRASHAIASLADGSLTANNLLGQRIIISNEYLGHESTKNSNFLPESVDGSSTLQSNNKDANLSGMNSVSSEQLNHFSNLSASLANYFGNGQPIPQSLSALNSHSVVASSTVAISEIPAQEILAASTRPDQVNQREQYDPICDSQEHYKADISEKPTHILLNPSQSFPDGKLGTTSKDLFSSSIAGRNGGSFIESGISTEDPLYKRNILNQPSGSHEDTEEKNEVDDKSGKYGENKMSQENSILVDTKTNNGNDDNKKNKDLKGIKAFKFALVEFVKDLLKPAWKDGQINKDAYKTIVKKVVDKVTGSMQAANLPQTQEKIDSYLSVSRPKLTKLVQAYVEKAQKG